MTVIYEPSGLAREYGELACSVYLRCTHSYRYCYCPEVLRVPRGNYFKKPEVRPGFLKQLTRDARRLEGDKRNVVLSFVGDCYQPAEEEYQLTRQAIQILHSHGMRVTILTKGGRRAMRDFDILIPGRDEFATTLTCLLDYDSQTWEPGAALPEERIESLEAAHKLGLTTWVSLEPVIYPSATVKLILATYKFTDHYKIGKMNYDPHGNTIDWAEFANTITTVLEGVGARYYCKATLAKYLGKSEGFWAGTGDKRGIATT